MDRINSAASCLTPYIPSHKTVQRTVLATSIVLSILSLVPSLRLPAALALRTIACLSSVSIAANRFATTKHSAVLDYLEDVKKVALVTLGLIGLALASPMILLVSVVLETAVQGFACIKAWYNGHVAKGFVHFGLFAVGALSIGAMASGAWQVIVVASVINAFVMLFIAAKIGYESRDFKNSFEICCYIILSMVSIVGAGMSSEVHEQQLKIAHHKVTNNSNQPMQVIDRNGNTIITIAPHETKEFTLDKMQFWSSNGSARIQYEGRPDTRFVVVPISKELETTYYQPPIPAHQIPTVPLTGLALATEETF